MTNSVDETVEPVRALAGTVSALGRLTTRARLRQELRGDGPRLSPTDSWLLDRLGDRGPARMSELAAWQAVDRSTMTVQVGRLEKFGLVTRSSDPEDRRAVLVCLSEAGREFVRRNREVAGAVYDAVVADWSEEERRLLTESLTRLVHSLEDHMAR